MVVNHISARKHSLHQSDETTTDRGRGQKLLTVAHEIIPRAVGLQLYRFFAGSVRVYVNRVGTLPLISLRRSYEGFGR